MSHSPRKSKRAPKNLSSEIDSILNKCQLLQRPETKTLSKNMESHMSNLSSAFEELTSTDLNPEKFKASQAYHKGKARLVAYIDDKTKIKRSLNKEQLQKLLHQETVRSQSKQLSFLTAEQEEISYLLKKNKRKFGETYRPKGFSVKVSPVNSNLPSINASPKVSPSVYRHELDINSVINSMIRKNLGMLQKKKTLLEKKKTFKGKRRISVKKKRVNDSQDVIGAAYLNPEFRRYNQNLENKLKVERLVVRHHAKERRASMALGLISKVDDDLVMGYSDR